MEALERLSERVIAPVVSLVSTLATANWRVFAESVVSSVAASLSNRFLAPRHMPVNPEQEPEEDPRSYEPQRATDRAHAARRARAITHKASKRRIVRAVGRFEAFNDAWTLWLSRNTGTSAAIYLFLAIGLGALIGALINNAFLAAVFGALSSYIIQLVMLAVIQKANNISQSQAEHQADELYKTSKRLLVEVGDLKTLITALAAHQAQQESK